MKFIFIIGAAKSGTTSLHNYLWKHSNICPSVVKEPNYFTDNCTFSSLDKIWTFKSQHIYCLDASTDYTKFPFIKNVPKNIHESKYDAKFIYLMRNPWDRIISNYKFDAYRLKTYDPKLFTKKLPMYGRLSNYYLQLNEYVKYFDKKNFLLLHTEDLSTDYKKVLKKCYEFLELPYLDAVELHENKSNDKTTLPLSSTELVLQKHIVYKRLKNDMKKLHQEWNVDVTRWGF